jgi:RimJ/RimL family protein N-acetyltransferase
MPGPIFLDGDDVTLRTATEEDRDFLRRNRDDPRVRASRSIHEPASDDAIRRRLGGTLGRNGDTFALLVCDDGEPVGFVYLIREKPNDAIYRHGELAYWTAPEEWGNGYTTAGSRLLLGHAFDALGLRRVSASAFADNHGSRRVLEKLGFAEEGVEREHALVGGEWTDVVTYGLLAEEWRANK